MLGLQFPALSLWTNKYLCEKMGDSSMTVAITPDGSAPARYPNSVANQWRSYADSISQGPDGRHYFVEPCLERMSMMELLSNLGAGQYRSGIAAPSLKPNADF